MAKYANGYLVVMDTNDSFVRTGFCPEKVRITYLADGQDNLWVRMLGNDASLSRVAAGDRTANTDKGIKLVQFTDEPLNISADPSAVDPGEFYKANGFQITSDVAFLADDTIIFWEAWGMDDVWVKCTHDDTTSSNTFAGDASYCFKEIGVTPGNWIVYNQTNGNYAYVKSIAKKTANATKYSRIYTATDREGTATTAADFDTSDVFFVFPVSSAWWPLSDIGLMT